MQDGSKKAIMAAFFANLGIAIAKFIGFLITRSAGLLAEAGHSAADTGNQALLLFGSKRGRRKADAVHPFGYGPERYFWAFVVALVLFSMGGLFALYEGINKLNNPHEIESAGVAFAILGLALALETFSLRTAVKEANHVRPRDKSWWWFVRNAKSPELPVVLLEDTGAEIGLLVALAGLTAAVVTDDPRWDAAGSIAIGLLLVVIAIVLAIEMKGLLVGEAPDQQVQQRIEQAIAGAPSVRGLIHIRSMHVGPDDLLVAVKVEFDHHLTVAELATATISPHTAARRL
ncbi:MAG: cation diffusion facilitator family transporter, partial [Actinomycetota bacterium]